jgi:phosphatidylserine/phosphatidylglycerophosphate/cardiolipin synthase-like enzyme
LYYKLKEDPASYPRGLTVRILLGNPPELAGQLWYLLEDLRDAGVEKMLDPEIGWRLEVADYAGNLPHSHVKMLVIDGKTAMAAGFNTTYDHFDNDHYSGKGAGRFDLGIQVSGPVAQESVRVFDDLWVGASRRHCSNFHPAVDELWQATCYDLRASGGHVPEVLRYYLPGGDSTVFSMYRSVKRDESDQEIVTALSSAQKTIDVVHVNFTMPLICDLNLLFDVCTSDQDLPFLDAMIKAAEEDGVRERIMITPDPFEGIESLIAINILRGVLEEAGVEDLVEVRFFEGEMHSKANLIDDEFLIIGSQNFHYSAFGEGVGLNEYNLGVSDPRAIEDFKRVYDYYWERSMIPDNE